jgi:EmrB/QacA subfamily drug resistance transporter
MSVQRSITSSEQTAPSAFERPAYLSHQQILVVLAGLLAGMLLAALDQSIVGVALPRIVSELGGLDQLSWVVIAYLLATTATTPLWGKISDLYGRRLIFQIAIGLFLIGSALSGLSQNMPQLIGFRALQGIGGGGLFSIAFAIIGDVIPPRDRGRYQGYFGGMFGMASVAGPLLGGWLTDGPGWRWIFLINIPVGLAALIVTSWALRLPVVRREHRIDYLGAALIVGASSALILYLDWAGRDYGYAAPLSLGMLATALVLATWFVVVESRASEPIIPLGLFRNGVFRMGNLFGFLAGFTMFGALIFLPLYLQGVMGFSPTISGLAMLPTVVGIFGSSIMSGQLISRNGRYKIYPIIGAAVLVVGLFLLGRLETTTPYWQLAIYTLMFGSGLGLTMQTILTAVQNAVDVRDMGTATASTTFFRQLGAAIGAAVFGSVLASRLNYYLAAGAVGELGGSVNTNNIESIRALTGPVREFVLTALTHSLNDVFLTGVPFAATALIVAFFIPEVPLASRQHSAAPPE